MEVDDLRAESGDDDGELAAILATMADFRGPGTSLSSGGSLSGASPGSSAPPPAPEPVSEWGKSSTFLSHPDHRRDRSPSGIDDPSRSDRQRLDPVQHRVERRFERLGVTVGAG